MLKSILINETLVEKVFDIVKIPITKDNLDEYEYSLISVLKEYKIDFKFVHIPNKEVSGEIREVINNKDYNYLIIINLPDDNFDKHREKYLDSILHELTHIITTKGLPVEIPVKTKSGLLFGRKLTRAIPVELQFNLMNTNITQCIQLLDYIFQVAELANFAFTVAFSCKVDINTSVKNFFDTNEEILDELFQNKITLKTFYDDYISKVKGDCKHLIEIQFAVKFLNSKVNELLEDKRKELQKVLVSKSYNFKLKKFLFLCMKYEKRLKGIYGL